MTGATRSLIVLGAFALAGGCTSIMENTTISQVAPAWFEDKSREVKGEGYPSLAEVPATIPTPNDQAQVQAQAAALKAESEHLTTAPELQLPGITEEELRARAAQLRAQTEQGGAAPQPRPSASPRP
jgi:hypothetical protein